MNELEKNDEQIVENLSVEAVTEETAVVEEAFETAEETAAVEEVPETAEEITVVEEPVVTAEENVEEDVFAEEETIKIPKAAKETKEKIVKPASDEFDWDAYEKGDAFNEADREEMTKAYDQTLNMIKDREVVEGTVISMSKNEVVVNVGYKSDGVVSMNEFRYNPDLQIGDKVEVYIESQEDKKGQLLLSHKQARASRSWDRVNEALNSDEIIKGFVKCRTKGGMIVDVFGIEAFLPGSQIDVKPIRDYDVFVNKTMEFKVVKINHEYRNVVVSHKALIEAELESQKKEIVSRLEKGQVLEGTVKNITSYGVFIDLGGVDGLIHITDLSWGRVNHPEEILQLDEKINVVILDFDEEKKRIALGLKQLTPHPWDALDTNLQLGDKISGKVVVLQDYGAFVEVADGVEGLIHVSEMSWSQHLRSAQDFMNVGDEVEAVILTLDREERKMSLGIKQLKSDPWEDIEKKYAVNSKHTAKVRNFTNFGVFVEIEEGVDGLIHISDLSWTKKIKHPSEFTQIGADMEVIVLEIDKENRRLSLGHKQLEDNPWDVFETLFSVDTIQEGTIVELLDKGAVIALPYGVEGFATPKHLVKEDGSQAKVNEKLNFKVIEFNKDAKRIILSHSRIHEDAQKELTAGEEAKAKKGKKAKKEETVNVMEKTTLGDIDALANLKEQMDSEAIAPKKTTKTAKEKVAKEVAEVTEVTEVAEVIEVAEVTEITEVTEVTEVVDVVEVAEVETEVTAEIVTEEAPKAKKTTKKAAAKKEETTVEVAASEEVAAEKTPKKKATKKAAAKKEEENAE